MKKKITIPNNEVSGRILIIGDRMLDLYFFDNEVVVRDGGAGNLFNLITKYLPKDTECYLYSTRDKDVCVKSYLYTDSEKGYDMTSYDKHAALSFYESLLIDLETEENIKKYIDSFDIVIFADHDKGFITPKALKKFYKLSPKANIIVDPKNTNTPFYQWGFIIKHNEFEHTKNSNNFIFDIQTFGCHDTIVNSMFGKQQFASFAQDYKFVNAIGAGDGFLAGIIVYLILRGIKELDKPIDIDSMIGFANLEAYNVCCNPTCYADNNILE